jgi:hypothetical protein
VSKPAERGAVRTGAAAAKVSYAAAQEDVWFCSAVKLRPEAVQAALNAASSEGMQAAAHEAVQEAVQAAILLNAASEGNTELLLKALATASTDLPVHAKDHRGYGRPGLGRCIVGEAPCVCVGWCDAGS